MRNFVEWSEKMDPEICGMLRHVAFFMEQEACIHIHPAYGYGNIITLHRFMRNNPLCDIQIYYYAIRGRVDLCRTNSCVD